MTVLSYEPDQLRSVDAGPMAETHRAGEWIVRWVTAPAGTGQSGPRAALMVWASVTDSVVPWTDIVSKTEKRRAAEFRQAADRNRSLAGAALLRVALATYLGRSARSIHVSRRCMTCQSEDHGRPYCGDGLWGSISHAGEFACAIITDSGPIGIDLESMDRTVDPLLRDEIIALEDPIRTIAELDVLTLWTRKEAVLKATGEGLTVSARNVWVSSSCEPAAFVRHVQRPELACHLADIRFIPGYVGAIAFA